MRLHRRFRRKTRTNWKLSQRKVLMSIMRFLNKKRIIKAAGHCFLPALNNVHFGPSQNVPQKKLNLETLEPSAAPAVFLEASASLFESVR